MDEHAGGVEDAAKRRPPRRRERLGQPLAEVAGVGAGPDLLAGALEHGPRRRRPRAGRPTLPDELVDGGQVAQASRNECKAAGAATLQTVRRIGLIAVADLAALAVAAVAAVAARDAVYWEKPLPGVTVSRGRPRADGRRSSWTEDATTSSPDEALRVDESGDARPHWCEAGHDSFLTPRRAARRPEPAGARRRPGARAAAGRRGRSPAALERRCRSPAAPRSSPAGARSRSSRREPGDAVDVAPARRAPERGARRRGERSSRRTRPTSSPTLTTPAAEAAVAEAQSARRPSRSR